MNHERNRTEPENVRQPSREGGKTWGSFFREQLLLWVQIGLCGGAVAFFLILKAVGGSFYAAAATWFFENYNDTVMTTSQEVPLFFEDHITVTESSSLTYTPAGEPASMPDEPLKGENP